MLRWQLPVIVSLAACGRAGFDPVDDAGIVDADAPWLDLAWGHRIPLTLSPNITGGLSDVPVLVTLRSDRIDYSLARVDGGDLRFTTADGTTVLAHEIERWQPGGESSVWLRVPELSPSPQLVWLYFDRADAAAPAAMPVWSQYASVWHLDATLADSKGTNALVDVGGATAGAPGRIGAATTFTGTQHLHVATDDPELRLDNNTSLSLSVWLKVDQALGSTQNVFRHDDCDIGDGDMTCSRGLYAMRITQTAEVEWFFGVDPGNLNGSIRTPRITSGRWYDVTAVRDNATRRFSIYLDGELAAQDVDSVVGAWASTGQWLMLGRYQDGSELEYLRGTLDEARVARQAFGPEWIRLQHQSMTDALITYGAPQTRP